MSQADPDLDDDLQSEYDFSKAIQGKHHRKYREGTQVVLLDPDSVQDEPSPA